MDFHNTNENFFNSSENVISFNKFNHNFVILNKTYFNSTVYVI